MTLGPVMLDLVGPALTAHECKMLQHPQVGGVILFTRNYVSVEQLRELVIEIHSLRRPKLLIGVDQEGGHIQRLRAGFARLPALRRLGQAYDENHGHALKLADHMGWLMAAELRAVGIDISFAPVLDLDRGKSLIIGDRALHHDPQAVADLAHQYMIGMRRAGMAAIGKHFPGHGGVKEDSHRESPVDERPLADILAEDVLPFERMIHYGLAGIMPAHVIYPCADDRPAGYSRYWLRDVLRHRLGFEGAIFSDDLSMRAAEKIGDCGQRAVTALQAGCDMALICNNPDGAAAALTRLDGFEAPASQIRLTRLHGQQFLDHKKLHASQVWRVAEQAIRSIDDPPWLEMDV
jgi:beta-N-acetylhexosaminidase